MSQIGDERTYLAVVRDGRNGAHSGRGATNVRFSYPE